MGQRALQMLSNHIGDSRVHNPHPRLHLSILLITVPDNQDDDTHPPSSVLPAFWTLRMKLIKTGNILPLDETVHANQRPVRMIKGHPGDCTWNLKQSSNKNNRQH